MTKKKEDKKKTAPVISTFPPTKGHLTCPDCGNILGKWGGPPDVLYDASSEKICFACQPEKLHELQGAAAAAAERRRAKRDKGIVSYQDRTVAILANGDVRVCANGVKIKIPSEWLDNLPQESKETTLNIDGEICREVTFRQKVNYFLLRWAKRILAD